MKLTLTDGSVREFENGLSGKEIASKIAISLGKSCLGFVLNGEIHDLRDTVDTDGTFEVITEKDNRALDILNHSCAHVLASAVQHLYPDAEFAFGPAIEEGFYYDIHFSSPISDKDFSKIEEEMKKIVHAKLPFVRKDISVQEAEEIFKDQHMKLEHAKELEGQLTIYSDGDFTDLCKGPHVPDTSYCKAFKLLSIAGAYFKGDKDNEQLTRIYGTCFFKKEDLDNHLKILEERKQSDHRRLGKEMNMFMISEFGPGLPFWLPNGMLFRKELENFWLDLQLKNDYNVIQSPIILSKELWETSGHWDHYKENMYLTHVDEKEFAIKPMNCPGAILVYKNSQHSYRDLPYRIAELGLVHRHEASGALNGLFRVRSFTQDDAHIFLTLDQIEKEVTHLLKLYDQVYSTFNLKYSIVLSTRPEEGYIGDIETWNRAEAILAKCLEDSHIPYKINPGDGAFYGPKLDFKLQDSLKRIWQCGTIQLDMNLPARFECVYTDADGSKKTPLMLHRAIFGSLERFTGIILEHFKGILPCWLAPNQVTVLPIGASANSYANKVLDTLKSCKIRCNINTSDDNLNKRIHDAMTSKTSYVLVVGDKEAENSSVSVRVLASNKRMNMSLDEFIDFIEKKISSHAVELD